ncbi:MAG: AraC family transcriptional regulator, partial [Gammaproteobacteria bacterium]|nr:AraC family transcriptional regulator [Gammaproteobacteria bacterium]
MLTRIAAAHQIDGDRILNESGLDPTFTQFADGRYPFEQLCDAWIRVATELANPAIGLEAGNHYSALDLQALGVAFLSSATLLDALQ